MNYFIKKSQPNIIIVLIVVLSAVACNHKNEKEFIPINIYGSYGSGDYQFNNPSGIHFGYIISPYNYTLFVADYSNNRIVVWPLFADSLYFTIGDSGSSNGQLRGPVDVTVTRTAPIRDSPPPENPYIYASDSKNHRVQKFDINGNFTLSWGSFGNDSGQFNTPTGIEIDFDNFIYVVDSGNHRIQVFDSVGNFVRMWGEYGNGEGQFNSPIDIAAIFDNNYRFTLGLVISDYGNNRVCIYDKYGNSLSMVSGITEPLGISVGGDRTVYAVSAKKKALYHFHLSDFRLFSENIDETAFPYDSDKFFITDKGGHQVYRYIYNYD